MCFRPADANMSVTCPSCGKEINAVLGIVPKECPFCGATAEVIRRAVAQAENYAGLEIADV